MFKHNLIELFKTFSFIDVKNLEKFLKSSYFNGSEKMITLYREIIKYYPRFIDKEFTKKNLSVKTSVSGRYNESTLRDALSELLRLTLQYLSISNFEKNDFDVENYLLDELLRRKSDKIFTRRSKNKHHLSELVDSRYLYNKFWHETLLFNHDAVNRKILHKKDAVERVDRLKATSYDLLKFYISEIISMYLNSKILANKYNIDHSKNPLNIIVNNLDLDSLIQNYNNVKDSMIIYLYKYLLEAFDYFSDEKYYFEYKSYFEENKHCLSSDEIAFHYNWMINYCILKKKTSVRHNNIDKELFNIYNELLINKYYKDRKNEYLSVELFRDIMIHGLFMKRYNWTFNFIKKFNTEVAPEHTENILNYSNTYFYCQTGNYTKALECYNKIVMNNFVYKYDIKNLVIKMYYELNYFEEALCEIRSFKEFLRNNALVTESRRIRTGNYLKYFEKLILFQIENNKPELDYLKKRITDDINLSYKEWLLNKISLLI